MKKNNNNFAYEKKNLFCLITGQSSWGISWYINDLLIPELTVERGQTYTFIVEGGNDRANPARYHPFYITSSPEGGYGQKTNAQQMEQKVYAGVSYDNDGYPYPTTAGRYCEWVHKTVDMSADSETFESFFETLRLDCDQGEPAKLVWTVAQDTPDLVYYQVSFSISTIKIPSALVKIVLSKFLKIRLKISIKTVFEVFTDFQIFLAEFICYWLNLFAIS